MNYHLNPDGPAKYRSYMSRLPEQTKRRRNQSVSKLQHSINVSSSSIIRVLQQHHNCLGLYYRGLTPCNECLGVLLHRLVLQKLMISFHVLSLISNRQKWCRYLRYFPDNFIIYTGVLVIGLVYCISSTGIENLLTKTFRSYRRN
jgi:hypothetical protein